MSDLWDEDYIIQDVCSDAFLWWNDKSSRIESSIRPLKMTKEHAEILINSYHSDNLNEQLRIWKQVYINFKRTAFIDD
jgi:hypothetical protein